MLQYTQLDVQLFNLFAPHDSVVVGGTEYSGTTGPSGVVLTAASRVYFSANPVTNNHAGFKICGATPQPAPPPGAVFVLLSGPCQVSQDAPPYSGSAILFLFS